MQPRRSRRPRGGAALWVLRSPAPPRGLSPRARWPPARPQPGHSPARAVERSPRWCGDRPAAAPRYRRDARRHHAWARVDRDARSRGGSAAACAWIESRENASPRAPIPSMSGCPGRSRGPRALMRNREVTTPSLVCAPEMSALVEGCLLDDRVQAQMPAQVVRLHAALGVGLSSLPAAKSRDHRGFRDRARRCDDRSRGVVLCEGRGPGERGHAGMCAWPRRLSRVQVRSSPSSVGVLARGFRRCSSKNATMRDHASSADGSW